MGSMKKYIIITADTNDADFVSKKTKITDKELKSIKPIIKAIKGFKPYKKGGWEHQNNYPVGECVRPDLGQQSAEEYYGHLPNFGLFNETYVPYGEYGIHTITSIELLTVAKETKLL